MENKNETFINTSGKGEKSNVPSEVKNKFNWGAFLLSWIWGIGNKTYITLIYLILGLIPIVNLGILIWFGIKGNEWAWRNKQFKSIPEFHENQKKWVVWSIICWVVFIILVQFLLVIGIFISFLNDSTDNPEGTGKTTSKLERMMDKMATIYFQSYTIGENENRFYVLESDWKRFSFDEKVKLLDFAAQTAAMKKEKEYKENNPHGYQYFSKTTELNKTKIYSANNTEKLLGEFYLDKNLFNDEKTKYTDIIKASLKAYRFYN